MIHIIDLKFQGLEDVIAAFIVETSKGPVLIETGPYSTYQQLVSGVAKTGYSINDIQHVLLSHIHFDHAGASWALAKNGASIYLHPVGAPHMAHPEKLVQSATRIYGDQMDILWGALRPIPEELLIVCNNNEPVKIGDQTFIPWHTPGHASHHIAWQWKDNLFTGDVAGVKIQEGMVVPPCPPPDINLEDWKESIDLIRKLPLNRLYLTHYGPVNQIESHLDSLEEILHDWAYWIKPYVESGTKAEEVVPLFEQYVARQLKAYGISDHALAQYESANPSYMSVSGLMRYWKKKMQL
jgi:glyoxylase-like metal-dependent hydrolase (beta-lactamase superfamily II)